MHRRIPSLSLLVALVLALWPVGARAVDSPPAGAPYAAADKPFGMSLAEWEAAWNQWFFSIPKASSPMTGGKGKLAGVGQRLPVWFLPSFASGDHSLSQTVPAGYALFVPVLNEIHADVVTSVTRLFTENQAKFITQDLDKLPVPSAVVDGVAVPDMAQYRVPTPLFSFLVPEDNLLGFGVPSGSVLHVQALAEGYNFLVPPLPVGKHVIQTQAMVPGDRNTTVPVNVTYQLTITAWPR